MTVFGKKYLNPELMLTILRCSLKFYYGLIYIYCYEWTGMSSNSLAVLKDLMFSILLFLLYLATSCNHFL
jgi:hypothetical protein